MQGYAKIAPYYDRFINRDFYKILISYLADKVIPGSDKRLLELGCGTGFFSLYYAKQGMDCVGIDRSAEMIKIARNYAKESALENICFSQGDMLKIPFKGKFDYVIIFFDVLNNILNPKDITVLFKKVHECLRPGGVFIFDILSLWGMKKMWNNDNFYEFYDDFKIHWISEYRDDERLLKIKMRIISKRETIVEEFVERGYEKNSLEEKLVSAGFNVRGICPMFFFKRKASRFVFYLEK